MSALQRHDLAADDHFIASLREVTPEAHLRESREDAARLQAYLRSTDRPTAVVTTNDYVALRLISAAESAGVHVPHDLAVTSCGWGGTMGAHARVPLTSVVQPLLEIGRQATHVLLDRMAGRTSKTRQITLPVSLIVRESCGAGRRAFALAARPAPDHRA
jgi:DNA-binding LacI/PurR family transcriptional regulator